MTIPKYLFVCIWSLLLCVCAWDASGQGRAVRDSVLFSPYFQVHGGLGSSAGDLGLRFGSGGHVGAGAHVKTTKNWFFGGQASFGFGMELKEFGVLSNLLTPTGQLIDNEGQVALLTLSGKGGWFTLEAGKLFPLANTNPNSGILVMIGAGSVHHRIHFENTENRITQLEEPYVSGYDRLTWGVASRQFLGYWHMSNNGLVNWFGGLELWEARTLHPRPMNSDTLVADEGPRFDAMASLQIGWVFHIYKRSNPEHWY